MLGCFALDVHQVARCFLHAVAIYSHEIALCGMVTHLSPIPCEPDIATGAKLPTTPTNTIHVVATRVVQHVSRHVAMHGEFGRNFPLPAKLLRRSNALGWQMIQKDFTHNM